MPQSTEAGQDSELAQLSSFLRGEISAVEAYRQVLANAGDEVAEAVELRDCMRSHEQRVMRLREEVRRRGGRPVEGSGAWGAFVRALEGGVKVLGMRAALALLEEGEDHGRADYQRDLATLGGEGRLLVEQLLLPEQLRTHAVIHRLHRRARGA